MILYEIPPKAQQEADPFTVVGFDPVCKRLGGVLTVEPGLRYHLPSGGRLMSTCISGGCLDEYIREQSKRWGADLWLLIEPMCHVFPLPCPDGQGGQISEVKSQALQKSHRCYDAPEFGCQYCVFQKEGRYYVHLFDTEHSRKKKLELAVSLQIENIIYLM